MAIVRWEPFRDLVTTQESFNRLFNQTFSQLFEGSEPGVRTWTPTVDVYETEQNLVLKAELPGIDPKDLEVRVEDGTLYLRGERKTDRDLKEGNYHRIERSYGAFNRTFALPGSIDADRVAAEYKSGVLTLTIPKKEGAKPKTIKVQVSGEEQPRAAVAGVTK